MRRAATVALLLPLCGAATAADQFSFNEEDLAVGAVYESLASGDFRLGDSRFDWDRGERAALAFRTRIDGLQRVETVGGVDLYGDWRSGDTPEGTLKDRAVGFDLQCALAFHLTEPQRAAIDLSFAPFLRAGIAWHQLSLDDVETNNVTIIDDASGARFAAAVGADARLVLGRRFEAYAGGGFQFWTGGTLTVNGYSGATRVSESISYSGQEAFVHLGVLFWLGDAPR